MQDNRPEGQRFSHVYMRRENTISDSPEVRFRTACIIEDFVEDRSTNTGYQQKKFISKELGREIARPSGYISWKEVTEQLTQKDFLDLITIVYEAIINNYKKIEYIKECQRVFKEEQISFEIDDFGGVHPLVDAAYQASKASTIKALSGDRYSATLNRIDEIDKHLLSSDYTSAIRSVFGANENLFKLMFGGMRLDKRSANDKLIKRLQTTYANHPTMQRTSARLLASFGEWIDAVHNYRHEEGIELPQQPNEELAIALISHGISFVRWLAAIDQKDSPEQTD